MWATRKGQRPKAAIDASLANHVHMIARVAEDEFHAIELIDELDATSNSHPRLHEVHLEATDNYRQWLIDEYCRKLRQELLRSNEPAQANESDACKSAHPHLTFPGTSGFLPAGFGLFPLKASPSAWHCNVLRSPPWP